MRKKPEQSNAFFRISEKNGLFMALRYPSAVRALLHSTKLKQTMFAKVTEQSNTA